jgi:hypothetical protein
MREHIPELLNIKTNAELSDWLVRNQWEVDDGKAESSPFADDEAPYLEYRGYPCLCLSLESDPSKAHTWAIREDSVYLDASTAASRLYTILHGPPLQSRENSEKSGLMWQMWLEKGWVSPVPGMVTIEGRVVVSHGGLTELYDPQKGELVTCDITRVNLRFDFTSEVNLGALRGMAKAAWKDSKFHVYHDSRINLWYWKAKGNRGDSRTEAGALFEGIRAAHTHTETELESVLGPCWDKEDTNMYVKDDLRLYRVTDIDRGLWILESKSRHIAEAATIEELLEQKIGGVTMKEVMCIR